MSQTTTAALIVAAGRGHRAGGGLPKQYRDMGGESVLAQTLRAFHTHPAIDTVCVVIHPDDQAYFDLANEYIGAMHCFGGTTRNQSVHRGLLALADHAPDHVLIHDAARPFVSHDLIQRLCDALAGSEAAVPGLPVTDATFTREQDAIGDSVDRNLLVRVQTPQAFQFQSLLGAFEARESNRDFPDEASLMRAAGIPVKIVDGEPANIKLTFPEDFQMPVRTGDSVTTVSGSGFDVHRLGPGQGVWLCGVEIPCEFELIGHSDADAGLHALVDALLGTIGAGDIGQHFPPSDPQWKGAASSAFVEHALALLHKVGAQVLHADITLICEQPRIGPFRAAMQERVAELLGLPTASVNIKATTTEGLGFTGRGEGIAAQAIVTVKRHA